MARGTVIGTAPTIAAPADFGAIVRQGTQDILAQQELKRQREEREQERVRKLFDDYGFDESLAQLEDTEFRTLDDSFKESVFKLRDNYYDTLQELKNVKDPVQEMQVKKRLGNINNSISVLKGSHDKMGTLLQDMTEKLQNDELSGVEEEKLSKILNSWDNGLVKVEFDEAGRANYLFYNEDGSVYDVMNQSELLKYSPYSKVDVYNVAQEAIKNIGKSEIDKISGRFINRVDEFGARQETAARTFVQERLQSDEFLADILNQATNGESTKKKDFTDEERRQAEDYLVGVIRNSYDESSKVTERPRYGTGTAATAESKIPFTVSTKPTQQGAVVQTDSQGNAILNFKKPASVDVARGGMNVESMKLNPTNGRITLTGQVITKVRELASGEQPTEEEVTNPMLSLVKDGDKLTINKIEDTSITYDPNSTSEENTRNLQKINSFAARNGMSDVNTMVGLAKQELNKYPAIQAAQTQQNKPAVDTSNMNEQELIDYYLNLNKPQEKTAEQILADYAEMSMNLIDQSNK
jgi:hypothetical protein